jgi:glycosyltransferase involved in cell wall biosynthesis
LREIPRRLLFARGVGARGIDLYHEPNYVPLRYDVPVVVTIHDLSWLKYPGTHPLDRVRWLERGLPRALERASAILVDSEFVRQEVLVTFGLPSERVRTALLGVSSAFRPRNCTETADTLRPLNLNHGEYLLTVGTIEPRKNVGHILAAYAALPSELRDRHPLVVAGAKGWRAGDLEKELRILAGRGQIRFLGHVPAEGLPDLFAGAAAFVFPSRYEGFGLPPLEAMASGVPVVVSDRASLPEVVGDAGLKLDPDHPERTTETLAALLEDPVERAALAARGLVRAATFTWEACAQRTLGAYRFALGG